MSLALFAADLLRRCNPFSANTVPLVASYVRELPVSIERMYENAIDGEHLQWLHGDTFSEMTLLDCGDWGWRGRGYLQPRSFTTWMELELRLDRARHRWITTTLRGLGKGNQVVTHAIPLADNRIKVIVDFYVPGLPGFLHKLYGRQLVETYRKLYDEDQWMMETRQQALDKYRGNARGSADRAEDSLELGNVQDIQGRLPLVFEFGQQTFRLVNLDGKLLAHSATCPHMLGPLQDAEISNGEIECPWHGYRFDPVTGDCTSGQQCRLPRAPRIIIDEQRNAVIALANSQKAAGSGTAPAATLPGATGQA